VTQLFTYLLTQCCTAATPTSVCLLLHYDSARRPRWPSTIADNLSRYVSCTQHTDQGKDFKFILTVKIETRHPIGVPFGREFSAFVIFAELWRPEVARPGNFVSNFCIFLDDPSQTVATARIAPKICQGPPNIWLILFQIASKSVHFGQSYCRTREDRFCPVEYLQYRISSLYRSRSEVTDKRNWNNLEELSDDKIKKIKKLNKYTQSIMKQKTVFEPD